jgi:hypothetical protein
MGVRATEKAIKGNLNSGSLTNKNEVFKLSRAISNWELAFFDLPGITDIQTKENLNEWLDEMELLFGEGMVEANVQAGYGGYGISRRVARAGFDFGTYREAYRNQILRLSNKDLTEARLLRNALAESLGDNQWKVVYDQYDNFVKQSFGLPLDTIKKEFQKKAIYQDSVFFIDSIGRTWNPSAYSEMWARTRSREIEDDIMAEEMQEVGLDVVQINNVSTVTPICLQFEGKFFSKHGLTTELPRLEIFPPFHPNCRHRMLPQREFQGKMLSTNTKVNKKVSKLRKGWSGAEKKAIRKQETWNKENRN